MLRSGRVAAHPAVMEAEKVQPLPAFAQLHDPCLGVLEREPQFAKDRPQRPKGALGFLSTAAHHDQESRRGGSHPPALAEPGVNLSAHRAPIVQPSGRSPQRQCANRPGWRRETSAMNRRARPLWRRKRLYFRMAHITSKSMKWRKTGYK